MKHSIIYLLLILNFCCIAAGAQNLTDVQPFKTGESLTYEGKYNKAIFRGIAMADFFFTVQKAPNNRDFSVKAEAKSKGTLIKLLGYKFYQKYQTTVDGEKTRALKTFKRDEQGERVRESETVFDYKNNKVTYAEIDPNDAARQAYHTASPISGDTHDLVSAIYALRGLPLAVGKNFELFLSDSGLVYKIPVRVTARERQKTVLGKIWCFRLEPEIFGTKRLIEQKGNMVVWITDDARRLPVRAQIEANIGRIEVKLKEMKFVAPDAAPKS